MTSGKNNPKDLKAPDEQDGSAGTGPAEEQREKSGRGSAMATGSGNKEERTQKPPSGQEVQAMRKKADVTMKEAAGQLKKVDVTGGVVQVSDEETMATSHGFVLSKVEVGRGSRAVIYKACNPSNKEIACKVTAVKNLKGIGKTRYLDSLKILRFLIKKPHVSLLATEEVFATSDKIYVFCPLMTQDLAHRMTQMSGVFTEEESLRIGRQVAEGIAFLHSMGVAHERIRFVSFSGIQKLFSCSSSLDLDTFSSTSVESQRSVAWDGSSRSMTRKRIPTFWSKDRQRRSFNHSMPQKS